MRKLESEPEVYNGSKTYYWWFTTESDTVLGSYLGTTKYKDIDAFKDFLMEHINADGLVNKVCNAEDFRTYLMTYIQEFYRNSESTVHEIVVIHKNIDPEVFKDLQRAYTYGLIKELLWTIKELEGHEGYGGNEGEEVSYREAVGHVTPLFENAEYLLVYNDYGDEYFVIYSK